MHVRYLSQTKLCSQTWSWTTSRAHATVQYQCAPCFRSNTLDGIHSRCLFVIHHWHCVTSLSLLLVLRLDTFSMLLGSGLVVPCISLFLWYILFCSWSITETDSVLCASECCVILQSIQNTLAYHLRDSLGCKDCCTNTNSLTYLRLFYRV